MKVRSLKILVSVIVIALVTMFTISNLLTEESSKRINSNQISFLKMKKCDVNGISKVNWSQKKQKTKGVIKTDSPDKFYELHSKIRTAPGKLKPDYKRNYRFNELAKAKVRKSMLKKSTNSIMETLSWVERGPANVGGRTRSIIVDPDDATHKTWFAGSVGGGVWKTTNGGTSWIPLTDNLPNLAVSCMEMSKSNTNVIYAGTGEGFHNADAVDGNGIMKTTDKGATWFQLSTTATDPNFLHINRLAIDPTNENIVVAATNSGIFKTIDGGASWVQKYFGQVQDLRANPSNFNTLFATTSQGVSRSLDAGDTWVLNNNAKFGGGERIEIAVSLSDTNRVYASVDSTRNSIYYTNDGGNTWTEIKEKNGKDINWMGEQGWYDNTIGVHPFNENIIYFGGIDLWKAVISFNASGVAERTSVAITDGYHQYPTTNDVHVDHHNITLFPINATTQEFIFLNGNDGGIAVSYNAGATFTEVGNNGYNTSQFYGVDKRPGAKQYFGGLQDNGTWVSDRNVDADKTTKYGFRIGGDGFEVSWHYTDGKKMIGGSQFNRFYKTDNEWQSSAASSVGFDGWGNDATSPFISKLAKSYSDPDLLYTITQKGVYKSENFGNSWSLIPLANLNTGGYFHFAQVTISIAEPQVVWAGAYSDALYVSKDGGLLFTKTSDNQFFQGARLSGIDTHPTNEAVAFAIFSFSNKAKILRTTDYGQTWQDITGYGTGSTSSNGFPNVAVYSVSVMPYNTDIIWAGTDIGLIESTDGGATWHLADNGLPQVAIWEIRIVDDEVVVATHGRGIWSVVLPELAGHKPPVATLAPTLNSVNQSVTGLVLSASLRSLYDSTHVMINNKNVMTIKTSNITDTTIIVPKNQTGAISVKLTSFKGLRNYNSVSYNIDVQELLEVKRGYKSDFYKSEIDFKLDGLTINKNNDFTHPSLNSQHPYPDVSSFTAMLKVPIIVAATDANLKYDDIAIIEPGSAGTAFGDEKFYDYVIVEASNGSAWIPLADGYDARYNSEWETAFGSTNGTESMYKTHNINLLDKFSAGDTLLIRFRLFSDQYTTGWGWSIDNIIIQPQFVAVNDENITPSKFVLNQNYPNPFNPSTIINYSLPSASKVKLQLFNSLGEQVGVLVNTTKNAGVYNYKLDASNFASGVYFYRISAESIDDTKKFNSVKKMLLLK